MNLSCRKPKCYLGIERKFANVLAKNIVESVKWKKRKCGDCEDLSSKYTTNSNILIIYFIYIANLLF